jgi:hypothetical protein
MIKKITKDEMVDNLEKLFRNYECTIMLKIIRDVTKSHDELFKDIREKIGNEKRTKE